MIRVGSALAVALAIGCGGKHPEPSPVQPAPLPVAEEESDPDPPPVGRLGDLVVPRRGAVDIAIDPRADRFSGRVEYDIEIARPVSAIWLNAAELRLGRAELIEPRGRTRELTWLGAPRGQPELVGLGIGRKVGPGRARLRITFEGQLGEHSGLFHQQLAGQWYAYTDFEPTDARSALPTFDDPKFKVRWQVSLRVPATMAAFSNTPPVRERKLEGGTKRIEFAETRPIASYVLAFAVGPFEVASAPGRTSVPVRVIVPRGLVGHSKAALASAARLLALAEEYMGTKSPYPKLDFIAVPEFNGAMENPGLITVAAGILLVDPREPPGGEHTDHIDLLDGVLAHEIAHYWFGDLATMRYWDELWLNEGLATWMSDWMVIALDRARAGTVIEIVDKSRAIRLDRRAVPRRVRASVRTAEEIGEQFSPTGYKKGGAIAAMFEAFVGTEANRTALRAYVNAHADGNVTSADIAKAWSSAAGRDLGPAVRSFVDQPGIPVVAASLECKPGTAPRVALRQEPYRSPLAATAPTTRWQIPICVAWQGGKAPACTLLDRDAGAIDLPGAACPAWIHPNPGERGYYLYTLPPDQLRALVAKGALTPREQAGLADDLDVLLRSGQVAFPVALDAMSALAVGGDPLTAHRILDTLELVAQSVVEPKSRKRFAALLALYAPLLRTVGVAGVASDSELTNALRRQLVSLAAREGNDTAVQKQALKKLDEWLKQPPGKRDAAVDSDLLTLAAAPVGGAPLYERVLQLNDGRFQPALAAFRQPALLERTLAAIRDDKLPAPLSIELLARLVADSATQPHALSVALARFGDLAGRIADTDRPATARVFAGVCRAESRPAVASALKALADKQGNLPPVATFTLETIDECIAFRRLHQAAAAAYLK